MITDRVAAIANFIGLIFKDPIGTIKNEFVVLGEQIKAIFINVGVGVLTAIKWIATQIDRVAGTNLASRINPGKIVTVPGPTAGQKAIGALKGSTSLSSLLGGTAETLGTVMGSNARYDATKNIPTGGPGAADSKIAKTRKTERKNIKKLKKLLKNNNSPCKELLNIPNLLT
jgi:hypothetical protein